MDEQRRLQTEIRDEMAVQSEMQRGLSMGLSDLDERIELSQGKLNAFLESIISKIDLVYQLQTLLVAHMIDIGTMAYYSALLGLLWLLTSFKTFRDLKLRAIIQALVSFLLERLVIPGDFEFHIRVLSLIALIVQFGYQQTVFVNYHKENNRLLQKVVKDSIEQTPMWFRKYKTKLLLERVPQKERVEVEEDGQS